MNAVNKIRGSIKLSTLSIALCFSLSVQATDYYISVQGDDTANGTSENTPWASLNKINTTTFLPGDKILLQSGGVWNGMLHPLGSGEAGNPITLGMYGNGAKPIINGGTASSITIDDGYGPKTGYQTVYFYNQDNWIIENLEITNDPNGNTASDYVYTNNSSQLRRGIYIVGVDSGILSNITIRNNYVHHVYGSDDKDQYGSGGIMASTLGKITPSKFDNILVEGNHVKMVNRTGIGVSTSWQRRPNQSSGHWQNANYSPWYPLTNVVIRNNYAENIGGDGIIPQGSLTPLVEHNLVSDAQRRSAGYSVGLWSWNSDQPVHQYNEVFNTRTTRDGQAFDMDMHTDGDIFQYNYSHDNEGGFVLFYGGSDTPDEPNLNNIARYNVSQNDKFAIINMYGSGITNAQIYNNTIYTPHAVKPIYTTATVVSATIENNIFQMPNATNWNSGINDLSFNHNIVFGNANNPAPSGINNLTSDPALYGPGSANTGSFDKNTHTVTKANLDGYRLTTNSPALNAGKIILNNGGQDLWFNAVSSTTAPHIGAYNGTPVAPNSNKVIEPGFELATSSWNIWGGATRVAADSHGGNYALQTDSGNGAEQTITLTPNTQYTLTGWLKTNDSSGSVAIGVKGHGSNEVSTSSNSESYEQVSLMFTTGASTTSATIYVYHQTGSSNAFADDISLSVTSVETAPAMPSTLTATTTSSSTIDLTWVDNADNETNVLIERKQGSGAFLQVASTGANTISFQDTNLAPNTAYTYRVRASNSAGQSGYTSEVIATTDASPSNLIQNAGFESGSANWNVNWFADVVSGQANNGSQSIRVGGGANQGSTEQTINNLSPNTTYTLSGWLKADDSATVVLGVKNHGATEQASTSVSGSTYQQRTLTFTTGNSATTAIIYVYKNGGNGYAYGDDLTLSQ